MDGAELATSDLTDVDLEAYVDSKLKRQTLLHLLKKYDAPSDTLPLVNDRTLAHPRRYNPALSEYIQADSHVHPCRYREAGVPVEMLIPGGGASLAAAPSAAPAASNATGQPRASIKPRGSSPAGSPRRSPAATPRAGARGPAAPRPAASKPAGGKGSAQAAAELEKLKKLAKELVEETSKPKQRCGARKMRE